MVDKIKLDRKILDHFSGFFFKPIRALLCLSYLNEESECLNGKELNFRPRGFSCKSDFLKFPFRIRSDQFHIHCYKAVWVLTRSLLFRFSTLLDIPSSFPTTRNAKRDLHLRKTIGKMVGKQF